LRVERFTERATQQAEVEEAVGELERECEILKAALAEHQSASRRKQKG